MVSVIIELIVFFRYDSFGLTIVISVGIVVNLNNEASFVIVIVCYIGLCYFMVCSIRESSYFDGYPQQIIDHYDYVDLNLNVHIHLHSFS